MDNNKIKKYLEGSLPEDEMQEVALWLGEHGLEEEVTAVLWDHFNEGIPSGKPVHRPKWKTASWIMAAACVAVLTFVAGWLAVPKHDPLPECLWTEVYAPAGSTRTIMLCDSTVLYLNSGSRVTYPSTFAGSKREIFIEGEVLAEVAKNPEKPFIVHSGEISVKVLGTTFDFKSYPTSDCVELLLVEGRVDLDVKNGQQMVSLLPGDYAQYTRSTDDLVVRRFDTSTFRSFADDGALHFYNLSLADIASDISRVYGVKVNIMDSELAATHYFAIFSNHETPEQIFRALNVDRNMSITTRDGIIIIDRKRQNSITNKK